MTVQSTIFNNELKHGHLQIWSHLETILFLIISLDKETIQFKHQKLFYTAHKSYKNVLTLESFGSRNLLGTSPLLEAEVCYPYKTI